MKLLQRFMDWYQGNNDIEKEPPRSGLPRVIYVVWNYPGKILLLNVLFLLTSLPLVTIPASLCALNRCIIKLFRVGYGVDISDYFAEWKTSVKRCFFPGLLIGAACFYGYYLMSLAGNFQTAFERQWLTGIGAVVMAFSLLMGDFLFVMSAMLDLRNRDLLKNAFILIFIEGKADIGILMTEFLFWNGILLTMPYSLFFVILFGIGIKQIVLAAVINPVIDRRILEPYQNRLQ